MADDLVVLCGKSGDTKGVGTDRLSYMAHRLIDDFEGNIGSIVLSCTKGKAKERKAAFDQITIGEIAKIIKISAVGLNNSQGIRGVGGSSVMLCSYKTGETAIRCERCKEILRSYSLV